MIILTRLLALPIHLYRWFLSPLVGPCCRFLPTCSEYALIALYRHGPVQGSRLIFCRLIRCHPWGGAGYDPVPSVRNMATDKSFLLSPFVDAQTHKKSENNDIHRTSSHARKL